MIQAVPSSARPAACKGGYLRVLCPQCRPQTRNTRRRRARARRASPLPHSQEEGRPCTFGESGMRTVVKNNTEWAAGMCSRAISSRAVGLEVLIGASFGYTYCRTGQILTHLSNHSILPSASVMYANRKGGAGAVCAAAAIQLIDPVLSASTETQHIFPVSSQAVSQV